MNREQAEKLLGALIFDDLDEPSKSELLAYLQTDDELRDRLADMRMAAKLACDAVNDGPAPALNERRLAQLRRLARVDGAKARVFPMRRLMAVAAVLVFGLITVGLFMPRLSRRTDKAQVALAEVAARQEALEHAMEQAGPASFSRAPEPRDPTAYSLAQDARSNLRRWRDGNSSSSRGGAAGFSANGNSSGMSGINGTSGMGGGYGGMGGGYGGMGSMMGGMGGMGGGYGGMGGMGGGYGGMGGMGRGEGELVDGPVADSDRDAIEMTGGQSLPGQRVVASDESAHLHYAIPTPSARMTGSESSDRLDVSEKMIRGTTVLKENSDVVVMDDQAGQPRLEVGGGVIGGMGAVQMTPPPARPGNLEADVRGRYSGSVQSSELSGAVASKKPGVTVTSPAKPGYAATFGGKEGAALNAPESGEGRERVPMLGDIPLTGNLLKSKSGIKKDLNHADSLELGKEAEELTGTATVRMNEVQAESNRTPRGPVQQLAEPNESPAAAASHFKVVAVNPWVMTDRDSMSTFALDVDTASYALCRRYIRSGYLPPVGAVRMEEFINAFDYAYPQRDDATFAVHAEGAPSPFAREGQDLTLLKIGVKARTVGRDQRRAAHLVFVVDASASMGQAERLPVVQAALNLLVDKLSEVDRVSLVTCANEARLHLEAVPAKQKDTIRQAIDAIQPAGPTNLMAGLKLGYAMARRAFVAGRINQVVLCSDGVANVGQTEADAVLQEVAQDRKQGITLTCVGVGYGAYNDAFLEAMADNGDGRYVFLDSSDEAREALVGQLAATLQTVAKDARIQVRFNPGRVRRYRLIGYENRDIEDRRFRDDTIDAGEVGSGQCSTALYELELTAPSPGDGDSDIGTVFVRYRNAETGQVEETSRALAGSIIRRRSVDSDPRFFLAAGVARLAEWLRQSEHVQGTAPADVQRVLDQVSAALPLDRDIRDVAAMAHQAENLPRAQ